MALAVDEALNTSSDPVSSSLFLQDMDGEGDKVTIAILEACGLFINIVDSRVILSQTAKEFLLREMVKSSRQRRWKNLIDIRNAHRVLSRICMTCLLYPEVQQYSQPPHRKLGGSYALFDYSASHWTHHVRECYDDNISYIRQTLKLYNLGDGSSCDWYQVYSKINDRDT